MHSPETIKARFQDFDRKTRGDIEKFGFSNIHVFGSEDLPSFTYSIGAHHSYDAPEMIVFGLDGIDGHAIISTCVDLVKQGRPIITGQEYRDFLVDGFHCTFYPVPADWYPSLFGRAIDFYDGFDFPAIACLWADDEGRYPDDPGFDEDLQAFDIDLRRLTPPQEPSCDCEVPPDRLN